MDEESVRKNMRLSISRRIFYVVICWIKNMTYTNGSDELFHDIPHTLPGEDGEIGALILDDLLFPLWGKETVVFKADGAVKTISHKVVKGHGSRK